jgi:hypothetical protein
MPFFIYKTFVPNSDAYCRKYHARFKTRLKIGCCRDLHHRQYTLCRRYKCTGIELVLLEAIPDHMGEVYAGDREQAWQADYGLPPDTHYSQNWKNKKVPREACIRGVMALHASRTPEERRLHASNAGTKGGKAQPRAVKSAIGKKTGPINIRATNAIKLECPYLDCKKVTNPGGMKKHTDWHERLGHQRPH